MSVSVKNRKMETNKAKMNKFSYPAAGFSHLRKKGVQSLVDPL
jgi:hypothetical protein